MEGEEEVDLEAQYQYELSEMYKEEEKEGERDEEEVIIGTLSGNSKVERRRTLQYKAQVAGTPICLLIDTGASHSFVNPSLAHILNLPVVPTKTLKVRSAGGEELTSKTSCKNVNFSIQDFPFEADLWVMEVKGYDIVLGIDWVADQDKIELMLKQGMVTVENKSKKVTLVTKIIDSDLQLLEGIVNVMNEIKEGGQAYYAQISKIQKGVKGTSTATQSAITALLDQFPVVFAEPKTLPPHRAIDHQIVLKPNSNPINLRPYRFSYFQKDRD